MNCKWLRSGFLSQYRIEIIMWVLIVEMLASPLADTHPRGVIYRGFRHPICGRPSHRSPYRASLGGDLDGHTNRGGFRKPPRTVRESLSVCGLDVFVFDPVGYLRAFSFLVAQSAECDCRSVYRLPCDSHSLLTGLLDSGSLRRPCLQPGDSSHAEWNAVVFQYGDPDERRLRRNCADQSLRANDCSARKHVGNFFRGGGGGASRLELWPKASAGRSCAR